MVGKALTVANLTELEQWPTLFLQPKHVALDRPKVRKMFYKGCSVGWRTSVTCNLGPMVNRRERSEAAARVRAHRARLRAQGLRPVQIWVPDVRSPRFAVEAHRQSLAVAHSEQARDDQVFIDAVSSDDE